MILIALLLNSCVLDNFKNDAEKKFADQHFKTAIACIELHKIRTGQYPENLEEIQFLGEWDAGIFMSVEYSKKTDGYDLNVIQDYHEFNYPPEFWKGLGIRHSNIKK